MMSRVLLILVAWAVVGVSGVAGAQVNGTQPPPPQPVLQNHVPPANGPVNGNGGCPSCGDCHGHGRRGFLHCLWDWLTYCPLPVPPCTCHHSCNCEYYPPLYTYFLPQTYYTNGQAGHGPGCHH